MLALVVYGRCKNLSLRCRQLNLIIGIFLRHIHHQPHFLRMLVTYYLFLSLLTLISAPGSFASPKFKAKVGHPTSRRMQSSKKSTSTKIPTSKKSASKKSTAKKSPSTKPPSSSDIVTVEKTDKKYLSKTPCEKLTRGG